MVRKMVPHFMRWINTFSPNTSYQGLSYTQNPHKAPHFVLWINSLNTDANYQTACQPPNPRGASHFVRWVHSLAPLKGRERFEHLLKATGMRYIEFPGKTVSLTFHLFLNTIENGREVEYKMGDHSSYTAHCKILCVEGPGFSDKRSPAIVTVEIISMKRRIYYYDLPPKYRHLSKVKPEIPVPGENTVIRILFDPRQTVDEYCGLVLSYNTPKLNKDKQYKMRESYVPSKYDSLLVKVKASDQEIGKKNIAALAPTKY